MIQDALKAAVIGPPHYTTMMAPFSPWFTLIELPVVVQCTACMTKHFQSQPCHFLIFVGMRVNPDRQEFAD
jgi:hypothetical protein